ncbi:MAG TPA: CopD family protein, partial [Caulobacteraceae bacterium]|nr:CopD family protein [Caulobacteraceae bacterium]
MNYYDLLRGLHIIAVIAWMAGMLYLPRLYVYHTGAAIGSEMDETFKVMEEKLLRMIINPAMVAAFVFGGALIWYDGAILRGWRFLLELWMIVKLTGVVFLAGWHGFLAGARRKFARGERPHSARFWRMTNELPFIAAIIMVLAVTTEFRF